MSSKMTFSAIKRSRVFHHIFLGFRFAHVKRDCKLSEEPVLCHFKVLFVTGSRLLALRQAPRSALVDRLQDPDQILASSGPDGVPVLLFAALVFHLAEPLDCIDPGNQFLGFAAGKGNLDAEEVVA